LVQTFDQNQTSVINRFFLYTPSPGSMMLDFAIRVHWSSSLPASISALTVLTGTYIFDLSRQLCTLSSAPLCTRCKPARARAMYLHILSPRPTTHAAIHSCPFHIDCAHCVSLYAEVHGRHLQMIHLLAQGNRLAQPALGSTGGVVLAPVSHCPHAVGRPGWRRRSDGSAPRPARGTHTSRRRRGSGSAPLMLSEHVLSCRCSFWITEADGRE